MKAQARPARAQDVAALNRLLGQPVGKGLALSYGPPKAWSGRREQLTLAVWNGASVEGMVTRSLRRAWVNGRAATVASVGQLRVDPLSRAPLAVLAAGALGLRRLGRAGAGPYFLATLMGENSRMGGLLERGRLGLPRARLRDALCTLSLRPQKHARALDGLRADAPWAALQQFWKRELKAFQFGPLPPPQVQGAQAWSVWRNGRVVAAALLQPAKSMRIAGLPWHWRWGRPLINGLLAPLLSWPRLPGLGEAVSAADLRLFCAEAGAEDAAYRLLEGLQQRAGALGLGSLRLCLSEGHPLASGLQRRVGGLPVRSRLALLYWPQDEGALARLDGRPAHIDSSEL